MILKITLSHFLLLRTIVTRDFLQTLNWVEEDIFSSWFCKIFSATEMMVITYVSGSIEIIVCHSPLLCK